MDDNKNNLLEIIDPDNNDFMDTYVNFESYNLDNFNKNGIDKSS